MKKLLFGILGLLVTISGWSAETNSGSISSVTVAGLVAQNGTPTPTTPIDIVSNNGVLKYSPNIFDGQMEQGSFITATGEETLSKAWIRSVNEIIVTPGKTYTFSCSPVSGKTINLFLATWDSDGTYRGLVTANAVPPKVYTVPNNVTKIRFQIAFSDRADVNTSTFSNIQVEQGSTATPYTPYSPTGIYTDGTVETIADSANHTANVATLLGVGDYRDTQNINTGAITRNVGVKVLDGTEDWIKGANYFALNGIGALGNTIYTIGCTHYKSYASNISISDMPNNSIKINRNNAQLMIKSTDQASLANFKSWLSSHPVIIIYPLATPTTESVAGQTMTTAPVNNRTGGVAGMTITTLLSSGASVVTTIATNAIKIATTAYNSARFSPVVTELNDTIATIRDVVTNTINQTKAIADLQATKQTRPDENCPAGKKCLLVEDNDGTPHWYEIIESAD